MVNLDFSDDPSPADEKLFWTDAQKKQKQIVRFSISYGELKTMPEPEADSAKAFKLLKNDLVDLFKTIGSSEPPEFMQVVKSLKPVILSAEEPSEWTQDMAALLFTLAKRRFLSDYLVSKKGFLWTLQAVIRSLDIEWIWAYPESKLKVSPAQRQLYNVSMPWAALQDDFSGLEPGAQNEILSFIEQQRPDLSLVQRLGYDLILLHPDWIHADLQEWLDLYSSDPLLKSIGLLLMPYATQAELLTQCARLFLTLSTQDGRQEMLAGYLNQRVFVLLERAKSQAAEALGLWSLSAKPAALRKRAAEALSFLRSPLALAVMASILKAPESKLFLPVLQANPEVCLCALLERVAHKPADQAAERLMQAMLQQNPDWTPKQLSPKALSLWQSLLAERIQQEPLNDISLTDLPADFLNPEVWTLPPAFGAIEILKGEEHIDPAQNVDLHPYVHNKPPVRANKDSEYLAQFESQLGQAKTDLDDLDCLSQSAALNFFNSRLISPDGLTYDVQAQSKAKNWYSYRSDNWESDCILERFALDGLNGLIAYAWEVLPAFKTLARICSSRLAFTMLKGLERTELRHLCAHWIYTYPLETALGLIPIVLHPHSPDSAREHCLRALCQLWLSHQTSLKQALESYDSIHVGVIAYFEALLAQSAQIDPFSPKYTAKTKLPVYWDATLMPRLELQSGSQQMPIEVSDLLAEACARSSLFFASAGLRQIKSLCTADSLAQFSRRMLMLWLDNGAKGKDEWMLYQVAYLADDADIRDLSDLISRWPGERAHARAMVGLDVLMNLARQGRVAALAALHQISLKCRFQALREAAEQTLKDFAREQSQSLEQILDQVVPDCGFDASGKRYLAIAEAQWLICIDAATWKAVLQSPDGKSQNKWPTSAGKEQEKAWKSLKKEIDGLMQSQILRLERAMVQMQSWELSRFNDYLVRHPLLRHLLPTLIWGWQAEEQGPWKPFQLVYQVSFDPSDSQSDFLFLDVSGQAFKAEQGHIRLLHPLEFQGERFQWKTRFMSIKQPFDQIERKLFWPDAADSATSESPAFAPRQVSAARLLQLSKKGLWKSLGEGEFERYFGSQRVMICSEIAAYALGEYKEVELFYIHALNEGHQKLPMAVLDPISYSELRRDLDWIGV